MTFSRDALLETYGETAASERDKGTYYERLRAAVLLHDPVQAEQYEQVWSWAGWAASHGWNDRDVGGELVAKLRATVSLRCSASRMSPDSSKAPFVRRAIMDSTVAE